MEGKAQIYRKGQKENNGSEVSKVERHLGKDEVWMDRIRIFFSFVLWARTAGLRYVEIGTKYFGRGD
jgi:hypothetical protein